MNKPIEELVGETDLRKILEGRERGDKENQLMVSPSKKLVSYNEDEIIYLFGQKLLKRDYEVLCELFYEENLNQDIIDIIDLRVIMIDINKYHLRKKQNSNLDSIKNLDSLEEIRFTNYQYKFFPEKLFEMDWILRLKIQYSEKINNIPIELFNLYNLKLFSDISSQIAEVPREISKLQKLETLDLQYNKLTKLPDEILELPKLQKLNLHYNNFGAIFYKDKNTKEIVKRLRKNGVNVSFKSTFKIATCDQ